MTLGAVTYNVSQNFDLETVIKLLEGAGFASVELRTGHKHGVEITLSADERKRVRRMLTASRYISRAPTRKNSSSSCSGLPSETAGENILPPPPSTYRNDST